MAYETTAVPIARSQELIRKMIYSHNGTGISFISQKPREGFEALVTIGEMPYRIRIMATCQEGKKISPEQEERRVWRVLFWHLKAMFESSDSGVIDIRDVIMPYIVMKDERTISEHIIPKIEQMMTMDANRLLKAGD
jgi:hypothetical protein